MRSESARRGGRGRETGSPVQSRLGALAAWLDFWLSVSSRVVGLDRDETSGEREREREGRAARRLERRAPRQRSVERKGPSSATPPRGRAGGRA